MFVYQRKINGQDALIVQNTTGSIPVEGADVVAIYADEEGKFTYASGTVDEHGEVEPGTQPGGLPEVTVSDDGKILTVVDGAWAAANAGECSVTSVNGKTGAVVIDATDVGLGNVENEISELNTTVEGVVTDVEGLEENKQDKLTAGTGIAITENGVISATNGVSFTVVAELPATGETNVIYLVAEETAEQDVYAEYIWVGNKFEKIGTTVTPISNYVPNTRTVAGNALDADISASTLKASLELTKSDVGLANVDNTSDANKPISTATQTALNAKQDTLVSGTNIKTINSESLLGEGNVDIPIISDAHIEEVAASYFSLGPGFGDQYDSDIASLQDAIETKQDTLISGTNIKTVNGNSLLGSGNITITSPVTSVNSKTGDVELSASDIGLGNVNNTSDADKPVSTATQTALDGKQDILVSGENIATINGQSLLEGGDIDTSLTTEEVNGIVNEAYLYCGSQLPIPNVPNVPDENGTYALIPSGDAGEWVNIANTLNAVANKQDTLVSGTNIKTINGTSILGSGNITTPSFDPTAIAGYDATKTQVLKHIQGTLTWVDSGEVTQEGNEVTLP